MSSKDSLGLKVLALGMITGFTLMLGAPVHATPRPRSKDLSQTQGTINPPYLSATGEQFTACTIQSCSAAASADTTGNFKAVASVTDPMGHYIPTHGAWARSVIVVKHLLPKTLEGKKIRIEYAAKAANYVSLGATGWVNSVTYSSEPWRIWVMTPPGEVVLPMNPPDQRSAPQWVQGGWTPTTSAWGGTSSDTCTPSAPCSPTFFVGAASISKVTPGETVTITIRPSVYATGERSPIYSCYLFWCSLEPTKPTSQYSELSGSISSLSYTVAEL